MMKSNKKSEIINNTENSMDNMKKQFNNLYTGAKPNDELEASFHEQKIGMGLSMQTFFNVIKYLVTNDKFKIEKSYMLDLSYSLLSDPSNKSKEKNKYVNYRGTIISESVQNNQNIKANNRINKFISQVKLRKSHVAFQIFLTKLGKNTGSSTSNEIRTGYSIMKKELDSSNVDSKIDNEDYNIRFKLSKELVVKDSEIKELSKLLENSDATNHINFRYKQRTSAIVYEDDKVIIRIDATLVNSSRRLAVIDDAVPRYELELEIQKKNNVKNTNDAKYVKTYTKEVKKLLEVINQSNFIISTKTKEQLLAKYFSLVGGDLSDGALRGMQVVSLEIQHATDKLQNKYAVTDKADGERYFMLIHEKAVYLISNIFDVISTGITMQDNSHDNTLIDGEYIVMNNGKTLFGAFDILFLSGKDVRDIAKLQDRIKLLDSVVKAIYKQQSWKIFKYSEFTGKFNIDDVLEFHKKQMTEFLTNMNNNIAEHDFVIVRKYFIFPYGVLDNEIFKYTVAMWKIYVENKKAICPYELDGTIYTAVEQKYTSKKSDIIYDSYKWKPEDKNSIDFYCLFLRDGNNNIINLFDNSNYDKDNAESGKNKIYRICYLYVGRTTQEGEFPILFQRKFRKYEAYLYLEDGEIRDAEGNPIQDGTVVEFTYNTDNTVDQRFRWKPLRTRYDKTETVLRYNRKYGNGAHTADRIWRSIANPVVFNDFVILANDDNFADYLTKMRSKVSSRIIELERRESAYYQVKTNLAKPFRGFHNWVKSVLLYSQFHPTFNNQRKLSVLDFGVGRGGDLMKYFASDIDYLVGIDPDNYNLTLATDGALSRYRNFKKAHPSFQTMYFINANPGYILEPTIQEKIIGKMTDGNKKLLEKFFGKETRQQFDCLTSMFSVHFLLSSDEVWNNFTDNINTYLKEGGLFLVTTINGIKVLDAMGDNDSFKSYFTDEHGAKKLLYEIVRKFKLPDYKNKIIGTGHALDIFDILKSEEEGRYVTEYLVDPRFFIKELKNKCNLELIEADSFGNLFNIHRPFFEQKYWQYEVDPRTRKFFSEAYAYYDQENEMNRSYFDHTQMAQYYIFRKSGAPSGKKTTLLKKQQKNSQAKQSGGESQIINNKTTTQALEPKLIGLTNIANIFGDDYGIVFEEKYDTVIELLYYNLVDMKLNIKSADLKNKSKINFRYQAFINDYADLDEKSVIDSIKNHYKTNIIIFTENNNNTNDIKLNLDYVSKQNKDNIIIYYTQKKYYPVAWKIETNPTKKLNIKIFSTDSPFMKKILQL